MVFKNCTNGIIPSLTLIKCNHSMKPAWAQNDAMMAAYQDNMTYLYRVNDDTIFHTMNWTEKLIQRLRSYNPPNIGVAGPYYDRGNQNILTYEFVHRTHVDIFGFYYPNVFINWYADEWITTVYFPRRAKKVRGVFVKHTQKMRTRYTVHNPVHPMTVVLQQTRKVLAKYIENKIHG